jgi:hypothetical protein
VIGKSNARLTTLYQSRLTALLSSLTNRASSSVKLSGNKPTSRFAHKSASEELPSSSLKRVSLSLKTPRRIRRASLRLGRWPTVETLPGKPALIF